MTRTFFIKRLVDAWQVYSVEIEASTPEEAYEIARNDENDDLPWMDEGVATFDHTDYTVSDKDGNELIGVQG